MQIAAGCITLEFVATWGGISRAKRQEMQEHNSLLKEKVIFNLQNTSWACFHEKVTGTALKRQIIK